MGHFEKATTFFHFFYFYKFDCYNGEDLILNIKIRNIKTKVTKFMNSESIGSKESLPKKATNFCSL